MTHGPVLPETTGEAEGQALTPWVLCACNSAREDFLEEAGYRQGEGLATGVPLGNDRLYIVRWWVGISRKDQQGGRLGVLASEQGCEQW